MELLDVFPYVKGSRTAEPALRRCEAVAGWNILTSVLYHPQRGFYSLAILAPETMYLASSLMEKGFLVTEAGRAPKGAKYETLA